MNEISAAESIKFLKNKKINLAFLDVRERELYVQGFAFGSINCPISNFKKNVNDLVPDKETVVLLIGIKNNKEKFKLFSFNSILCLDIGFVQRLNVNSEVS